MRNITVALGSFILGAVFMSLVENHTSTLAQEPERMGGWRVYDAVPKVPPFRSIVAEHQDFTGSRHFVDGILCRGCIFNNTTLVYGGGEFAISEPRISGPILIKLDGAASNTAVFLNYFGLLGCPANNAPRINPPPIMKAKYTPEGDFQIVSSK